MAKNCRMRFALALAVLPGLAACASESPRVIALAPSAPAADAPKPASPEPVSAATEAPRVIAPAPRGIEVIVHTDPITGKQDGPFDKETGMRILTETGADGVIRIVRDPVSGTPVLLNEQKARMAIPAVAPAAMAMPAAPASVRLARAANLRSGPGTSFSVVTSANAQTVLTPTGNARNGWTEYRLQTPSGAVVTGWVADTLVAVGL